MRSETNESYFKVGQPVNLFSEKGDLIGRGKVRRVLNEGASYAVIIDGLTMILPPLIVLPNGLIMNEDMIIWLTEQRKKLNLEN